MLLSDVLSKHIRTVMICALFIHGLFLTGQAPEVRILKKNIRLSDFVEEEKEYGRD